MEGNDDNDDKKKKLSDLGWKNSNHVPVFVV